METKPTIVKVLNISEKTEVKNYPYGRLRTSAFFSIEFNDKKGFRSVFQTINPKNGRLNAEKKSTYSAFLCQCINSVDHVVSYGSGLHSYESVNQTLEFINKHKEELQLTHSMLSHIYATMINCIRINAAYTSCDKDELMKVIKQSVQTLTALFKNEGVFLSDETVSMARVDVEAIKRLEEKTIA